MQISAELFLFIRKLKKDTLPLPECVLFDQMLPAEPGEEKHDIQKRVSWSFQLKGWQHQIIRQVLVFKNTQMKIVAKFLH